MTTIIINSRRRLAVREANAFIIAWKKAKRQTNVYLVLSKSVYDWSNNVVGDALCLPVCAFFPPRRRTRRVASATAHHFISRSLTIYHRCCACGTERAVREANAFIIAWKKAKRQTNVYLVLSKSVYDWSNNVVGDALCLPVCAFFPPRRRTRRVASATAHHFISRSLTIYHRCCACGTERADKRRARFEC